MPGAVAIDGEGHDDETRTDSATDDEPGDDPDRGADGRRRGAQGSPASLLGAAPAGDSGALDGGVTTAHYTVEMRAPVRERGQRIRGLGSFAGAQQLDLEGVR